MGLTPGTEVEVVRVAPMGDPVDEETAMILSGLTTYLTRQKRASLIDLAHHFGSDPEALRGMLSILERKGCARRLPAGTICGGGCSKCDPASIEIYM